MLMVFLVVRFVRIALKSVESAWLEVFLAVLVGILLPRTMKSRLSYVASALVMNCTVLEEINEEN
jgi:hypothetical protein